MSKQAKLLSMRVLDDSRTSDAAAKLSGFLRMQREQSSTPQHVPTVYTTASMVDQIKACHFKESDIIIEYSRAHLRLLDLRMVRFLLRQQEDCDDNRLIPGNHGYAVIDLIWYFLSQALPLPSYQLQFLF